MLKMNCEWSWKRVIFNRLYRRSSQTVLEQEIYKRNCITIISSGFNARNVEWREVNIKTVNKKDERAYNVCEKGIL